MPHITRAEVLVHRRSSAQVRKALRQTRFQRGVKLIYRRSVPHRHIENLIYSARFGGRCRQQIRLYRILEIAKIVARFAVALMTIGWLVGLLEIHFVITAAQPRLGSWRSSM